MKGYILLLCGFFLTSAAVGQGAGRKHTHRQYDRGDNDVTVIIRNGDSDGVTIARRGRSHDYVVDRDFYVGRSRHYMRESLYWKRRALRIRDEVREEIRHTIRNEVRNAFRGRNAIRIRY